MHVSNRRASLLTWIQAALVIVGVVHLGFAGLLALGHGIAESPYDTTFFVVEGVAVSAGACFVVLAVVVDRTGHRWPGVGLVIPAVLATAFAIDVIDDVTRWGIRIPTTVWLAAIPMWASAYVLVGVAAVLRLRNGPFTARARPVVPPPPRSEDRSFG